MNKDIPDLFNTAMVQDYTAILYRLQGDYREALRYYTDSLGKYEKTGMVEHLSYAHVLSGAGFVHYRLHSKKIGFFPNPSKRFCRCQKASN